MAGGCSIGRPDPLPAFEAGGQRARDVALGLAGVAMDANTDQSIQTDDSARTAQCAAGRLRLGGAA